MRVVGYACGGLIAVGLTAFTVLDRGETVPHVPTPESAAVAVPASDAGFRSSGVADPAGSPDAVPSSSGSAAAAGPGREGAVAGPEDGVRRGDDTDRSPARAGDDDRAGARAADRGAEGDRDDVDRNDDGWDGDDRDDRRRWRRRYREPLPSPSEWEPPEGPVRIALQAGHWKSHEAPSELSGLRGGGTWGGGLDEWEANLAIARSARAMLEELGYIVDVLPAVVPPAYRAHLFISIHADGSNDPRASGFRVAAPRRDATGRASGMVELLEESYGRVTGLQRLPRTTRRMRNYYAFNSRRYAHALHPMTIGVIIETGFLTSAGDRRIIVDDPDRPARAIVEAVKAFPVTPPPETVAVDGTDAEAPGRDG